MCDEISKNYWMWRLTVHNNIQSGNYSYENFKDGSDCAYIIIRITSISFYNIITCLFLMLIDQVMYPFKIYYLSDDFDNSYLNCCSNSNLFLDILCFIFLIPINILFILANVIVFIVTFPSSIFIMMVSFVFIILVCLVGLCIKMYDNIFKNKMVLPK